MMVRISGVQRPLSRGTADRKYRGATTVKTVTGFLKYGFTFKYHIKGPRLSADAVLVLLEASILNETILDVCFLNQRIAQPAASFTPGSNAVGVRGPVVCTKLDLSEEDEEGVTFDVELMEVEEEQAGLLVEIAAFSVPVVNA